MRYSSSLLLLAPIVLCAPIQQWTVNNQQQQQQQQQQLSGSNHDQTPLPMMNLMIHDDIQNHYENMVDEVISTHSEDILFQLAHAMNDRHSLERLLQPQAIALLHHPVQETCLKRMPSMIAKHLHDLHTKVSDSIEPTLASFISLDQQQDTDMMQQVSLLNIAMDQKVMTLLKHDTLEHKVALDLSTCENQLVEQQPSAPPPKQSLWLLLKHFWKTSASQNDNSNNNNNNMAPSLEQEDESFLKNDSIYLPESTLLRSHLDMVADNLHMEFKLRLIDLYRTLRTDIDTEELLLV